MSYHREIPRDLFNEAKLLKCLGQLTLGILDNRQGISKYIHAEYDNEPFDIQQTIDGEIFVSNLLVYIINETEEIELFSLLNSKENYPLMFTDDDGNIDSVFNEDGKFSKEFMVYVKSAKN